MQTKPLNIVLLSMIPKLPIGKTGTLRPELPFEKESRPHHAGPGLKLGEIESGHHGPHAIQLVLVDRMAHASVELHSHFPAEALQDLP